MTKLTFFDLEYANTYNQSICQIGVVCCDMETGDRLYPDVSLDINPQDEFDEYCIGIHHITPDRVENCPSFAEVWPKLADYFDDAVVSGHNVANSDLVALTRTLQRYAIEQRRFRYVDTERLARQYIAAYCVPNYRLSTLCCYMGVNMGTAHDALCDARAAYNLLYAMAQRYDIPLPTHICTFNLKRNRTFGKYISDLNVRRDLCHLWGVLCGIDADGVIEDKEIDYLRQWCRQFAPYTAHPQIAAMAGILQNVLDDRIVTGDELDALRESIEDYLSHAAYQDSTMALRQLRGLLVGIALDGTVNIQECRLLYQWIYGNARLSMQSPYTRVYALAHRLLSGQSISPAQSKQMIALIDGILDTLTDLTTRIYDVCGKHVCLTGKFGYGTHQQVANLLCRAGATVDRYITKNTQILVRGDADPNEYLFGKQTAALSRALQYRAEGHYISIIKENDLTLLSPDNA